MSDSVRAPPAQSQMAPVADASLLAVECDSRQGWRCRSCAEAQGQPITYPPSPDAYCAGCRRPLEATERLAAAATALVRLLTAQPAASNNHPETAVKETCTVKEAAALLGTTPRGLYALYERGKLPASISPSRRLLFRRSQLVNSPVRRASSLGRNRR